MSNVLEHPHTAGATTGENATDTGAISREEAAYLAGICDGEGYFSVQVVREAKAGGYEYTAVSCRVRVGNTCPLMIKRISEILYHARQPIKFYYGYQAGARRNKRDSVEILVTGDMSVARLLGAIIPFLTTKREQALAMLDFIIFRQAVPPGPGKRSYTQAVVEKAQELESALLEIRARRFNLGKVSRVSQQVFPWRDSTPPLPETTKTIQ